MPDLNLRLAAAIAAGKAAGLASRALGIGGGTTLPGVVARRIAPDALRRLSAALPQGVVLVGGTNGKTTTTRMLATILSSAGRRVLHNRAGANLVTGLTATALAGSTLAGQVGADIGLFETDEAALPQALVETRPRLLLLHNLFRDQLDRYGEVDAIAAGWRAALEQLPAGATVLLNADDPAIAALGQGLAAQVRYYGMEDPRHTGGATHLADAQFCRRCGAPYQYSALFYAHVGHYACARCGHHRPQPHYRLERLELEGIAASRLFISFPIDPPAAADPGAKGYLEIRLPLPGLYNALNALAAASAALLLGVAPVCIRDTLETFSAAFGRIERVDAGGKPLLLALIKNPVGASETVRMLTGSREPEERGDGETEYRRQELGEDTSRIPFHARTGDPVVWPNPQAGLHLLIAINDNYADGTDVSWLWDADFERMAGRVERAVVSGTRVDDMAVRLKYAGVEPERLLVEPDLARALDAALARLPAGATLYALPTYTAMLELRAELARRGWVRPFWED
jgi:UDP-N-acetylmuramyl tripeptide synthase